MPEVDECFKRAKRGASTGMKPNSPVEPTIAGDAAGYIGTSNPTSGLGCAHCEKRPQSEAQLMTCGRCRDVYYCRSVDRSRMQCA